jgi:hypothetical protein
MPVITNINARETRPIKLMENSPFTIYRLLNQNKKYEPINTTKGAIVYKKLNTNIDRYI